MTQSYTLAKDIDYPTLFRMGEWGINAVDRGEYAFTKIDSIIVHNCGSVQSTDRNWQAEPLIIIQEDHLNRPCSYCQELCPPEIQALWRLQNMENL